MTHVIKTIRKWQIGNTLLFIGLLILIPSCIGNRTFSAQSTASVPPNVDAETEQVAAFYHGLLQSDAPTSEQEASIFRVEPAMIRYLATQGEVTGQTAPIFSLFRAHKDLFIPAHMKAPKQIQISSSFEFPRNAESVKIGVRDVVWVTAVFPDDATASKTHEREVVFQFENGKIEPDAIYLGGFGGTISGMKFFGQN